MIMRKKYILMITIAPWTVAFFQFHKFPIEGKQGNFLSRSKKIGFAHYVGVRLPSLIFGRSLCLHKQRFTLQELAH